MEDTRTIVPSTTFLKRLAHGSISYRHSLLSSLLHQPCHLPRRKSWPSDLLASSCPLRPHQSESNDPQRFWRKMPTPAACPTSSPATFSPDYSKHMPSRNIWMLSTPRTKNGFQAPRRSWQMSCAPLRQDQTPGER